MFSLTEKGTVMLQIDLLKIKQRINLTQYYACLYKLIKGHQGYDLCDPLLE